MIDIRPPHDYDPRCKCDVCRYELHLRSLPRDGDHGENPDPLTPHTSTEGAKATIYKRVDDDEKETP